jgi:hypothetical protein
MYHFSFQIRFLSNDFQNAVVTIRSFMSLNHSGKCKTFPLSHHTASQIHLSEMSNSYQWIWANKLHKSILEIISCTRQLKDFGKKCSVLATIESSLYSVNAQCLIACNKLCQDSIVLIASMVTWTWGFLRNRVNLKLTPLSCKMSEGLLHRMFKLCYSCI